MDTTQPLLLTADAIRGNAADYQAGAISLETFKRRYEMLINSVHRSDFAAAPDLLAENERLRAVLEEIVAAYPLNAGAKSQWRLADIQRLAHAALKVTP